ncbi:hypothetical protein F66182_6122 [Fusarium sp. NRRL 66182]|nr:hypothetical protein F66182_6122 [Fusarium sp. NRRL 66182]
MQIPKTPKTERIPLDSLGILIIIRNMGALAVQELYREQGEPPSFVAADEEVDPRQPLTPASVPDHEPVDDYASQPVDGDRLEIWEYWTNSGKTEETVEAKPSYEAVVDNDPAGTISQEVSPAVAEALHSSEKGSAPSGSSPASFQPREPPAQRTLHNLCVLAASLASGS